MVYMEKKKKESVLLIEIKKKKIQIYHFVISVQKPETYQIFQIVIKFQKKKKKRDENG